MKRIKDITAVVTALIIIAALTFGVYYGTSHKVSCIGNFCYKADTQLKAEYFDIDPDRLNVYALIGDDAFSAVYRDCTENMVKVFGDRICDDLELDENSVLQYTVMSLENGELRYIFFEKNFGMSRSPTALAIVAYSEMSEKVSEYIPDYMNFAENLEMLVQADDLPKKILSRRHYPYTDFFLRFQRKAENVLPDADGFTYIAGSEYTFDDVKGFETKEEIREAAERTGQPFAVHSLDENSPEYSVLSLRDRSLCYCFYIGNRVVFAVKYPSLANTEEFYSYLRQEDYPTEVLK